MIYILSQFLDEHQKMICYHSGVLMTAIVNSSSFCLMSQKVKNYEANAASRLIKAIKTKCREEIPTFFGI